MAVLALVVATTRASSVSSVVDARCAALTPLGGVPLVAHAVRGLIESDVVDRVVVLARPSEVDDIAAALIAAELVDAVTVVPHLPGRSPVVSEPMSDVLLLHEVTRARVPADLVRRVVAEVLAGADAVAPVLPCSDTVKRLDPAGLVVDTPDRSGLRVLQTPRAWSARLAGQVLRTLIDSVEPAVPVTATMRVVAGHPDARELTSPFALAVAGIDTEVDTELGGAAAGRVGAGE
ncbi:MAG TPA: 2-C-methyl-D-erythritol 4-phosphate cytidylyltransferase [Pseudonocardiaceae bacterium]